MFTRTQWRLAARRRAFTFVELVVAVAIMGLLAAALLPGIQAARESSRRAVCQNNLRQIGVALQGYETRIGVFPVGAKHQRSAGFPAISAGTSWWLESLPDIEQRELYDRIDQFSTNSGFVLLHTANGKVIHQFTTPVAHCPSTQFSIFEPIAQFQVMMPSYVGISGASTGGGFNERRTTPCCVPRLDGEISSGGLLVPNRAIAASEVTDGLSRTLIVGESSAFAFDSIGTAYRIDGGFRSGWLLGTSAIGTPPSYEGGFPSWNITTVRYAINETNYNLPGVYSDHGANNPLLSSHPRGANLLTAGGAVTFFDEHTDLLTLKTYATRDDANIVD